MQEVYFLITGFVVSVFLALLVIPRILVISHKKQLYDVPSERKVHTYPVPRLGGLSFFPVTQMSFFLVIGLGVLYMDGFVDLLSMPMLYEFLLLFVGLTLLYLLGVCDDLVGVSYRNKFLIQFFAALLFIFSRNHLTSLGGFLGMYGMPSWIGLAFTVFIVVYVTNAINLIDGIDGLASGLCSITLLVLSLIFVMQADWMYALLSLCTLGVVIPFWFFNVFGNASKGHKLFMGDAGSLTLGYLVSFLLIHLCVHNQVAVEAENPYLMVAFSTVLVPLFDVIRVVVRRLRIGRNPFMPDKNHFHHKLLRTGMSVRQVMVTILAVDVFFILLNWVLAFRVPITYLFLIDWVLWVLMHLYFNTRLIRD